MGVTARRATLQAGDRAADFTLPGPDGAEHSLSEMLRSGPVLLAFFKISCPTCQLTFPFLGRVSRGGIRFVGISQDDAGYTRMFAQRFHADFDMLLDSGSRGYEVSNAYGITHVPTMFLVETDGRISDSWTGFGRADMERLAARVNLPMFGAGEQVPQWKAG